MLAKQEHSVRNAVLVAALAGLTAAVRRERTSTHSAAPTPQRRALRIGRIGPVDTDEVLWYC